jgi:hypothetical protein
MALRKISSDISLSAIINEMLELGMPDLVHI